jgi:hypothetical protein
MESSTGCRLLHLRTELGPILFDVPESIAAGLFAAPASPSREAQRRAAKRTGSEFRVPSSELANPKPGTRNPKPVFKPGGALL